MQKEFEIFYQNDVVPALAQALEAVDEIYRSQSRIAGRDFKNQFARVCTSLKKHMDLDDFQPVYIYFNLLRTRLIRRNYEYAIYVYDKLYYLKDGIHIGDFDVSFLFQPYDALWDELLEKRRKYIGRVSTEEVRDLMLSLSERFHEYVVEFLRLQMKKAVEMEEYLSIERKMEVEIASGEFFEPCDLIYIENLNKRVSRIYKKLRRPENGIWQFKDFRGVNLEGLLLGDCDFRYADFCGAKLRRVEFDDCLLDGSRFEKADLREASFVKSIINDTDFTEADLKEVDFTFCVSQQVRDTGKGRRQVRALGSIFHNANLQSANFQNAIVIGGDFTGACLDGAKFDGAFLLKSRFDKELIPEGIFTVEQRNQICMV